MAVEVLILSGARQGDRMVLDAESFAAGNAPDCAVYFDPHADACAANRSVSFRLMEDGWYIVRVSGTILLNQRVVSDTTRIRSGDVVRMSESGPDFCFRIVAGASSADIKAIAHGPQANNSPPELIAVNQKPGASDSGLTLEAAAGEPSPTPAVPSAAPAAVTQQKPAKTATNERLIFYALGALVVCLLLVLILRGTGSPTVNVTLNNPLTTKKDDDSPKKPTGETATSEKPPVTTKANLPLKSIPPQASPPPTAEERLTAQIADAVYLIEVEKADHYWPLATCCAIGKNTLLTSARETAQLFAWRKNSDYAFKIWIANPGVGKKLAVKDIYLSAVFLTLKDKPTDWIYYDLALLTVEEDLPKIMPLASPGELSNLREGMPVYCCGYAHTGEKISEYDHFQPQAAPAKIFLLTTQANLPSRPRLLNIKGNIYQNAFGSPIVNERGKILGVYGESLQVQRRANESEERNAMKIYYAPLLNVQAINLALNHDYGNIWLAPDFNKSDSGTKR
ncbi:MAG: hypothetical protein ACWGMZ_01065 [Thermoguttaceae bacterium]